MICSFQKRPRPSKVTTVRVRAQDCSICIYTFVCLICIFKPTAKRPAPPAGSASSPVAQGSGRGSGSGSGQEASAEGQDDADEDQEEEEEQDDDSSPLSPPAAAGVGAGAATQRGTKRKREDEDEFELVDIEQPDAVRQFLRCSSPCIHRCAVLRSTQLEGRWTDEETEALEALLPKFPPGRRSFDDMLEAWRERHADLREPTKKQLKAKVEQIENPRHKRRKRAEVAAAIGQEIPASAPSDDFV
jgi:hypothetical protein